MVEEKQIKIELSKDEIEAIYSALLLAFGRNISKGLNSAYEKLKIIKDKLNH